MGFLSQRVKGSDLESGDHIYTWRTPVFAYTHHGIYIGGGIVVHFTQDPNLSSGDSSSIHFSSSASNVAAACLDFQDCGSRKHRSGVVISCLNCFLGNGSLYRFEYGVSGVTLIAKLRSGTCTTAKSDTTEAVIHRAMYLLQKGFGKYDVFSNNCEDFALYCKTGRVVRGRKGSGGSGQASSVVAAPVALILSLPSQILGSNPYVFCATTLGNYTLRRYCDDIGVRDDVIKVEVEDIAAFHGNIRAEEDVRADGVISEVRPKEEGSTKRSDDSINPSGKACCRDGPCQLRQQLGDCQWFEEPCIGRVKEILSDLFSRNKCLKEKLKSAEKDKAWLAESLNEYNNACEAETSKLRREKEMLKQDLNQLQFKFNALIIACALIAFLALIVCFVLKQT